MKKREKETKICLLDNKFCLKYKENKYMVQKAKKCIPDFAELLHNESLNRIIQGGMEDGEERKRK